MPRRQLLGQLLAATGTLRASPLFAAAPMPTGTAVSAHRLKLRAFEVATILDGFIELPPTVLQGDLELIKRAMESGGLGAAPIRTAVNCFLVNTGSKLVMINCGGAKMLGANAGRMPQALAQRGIDPGAGRRGLRHPQAWRPPARRGYARGCQSVPQRGAARRQA